jgi:hypothetical protein
VTLELGHRLQKMDHTNDHHEKFFSPTTATYIELLSAAGLVASAARGEQEQRRTLYAPDNAHAPQSKVLCISCYPARSYQRVCFRDDSRFI